MRFAPAGDVALCVEVGDDISVAVNTRVRALEYLIAQQTLLGGCDTMH